ncbi:hypothetical protein HGRIS_003912 [Hohenbuehelia grisea]
MLVVSWNTGYNSGINTFYNPRVRADIRNQWQNELAEHDAIRKEWRLESDSHHRVMAAERKQADEERRSWDFERKARIEERAQEEDTWRQHMEELKKGEADERARLQIKFADPQPNDCKSYGVREYSAELLNIPDHYDGLHACSLTSVVINGVTMESPAWCESTWTGSIIGHWDVQNEAACRPFFNWFKDKGCAGWGSRTRVSLLAIGPNLECSLNTMPWYPQRYEAYLDNIYSGNWEQMCTSTPATINGVHFDRPNTCANWGERHDIWGIWFLDDPNC